MSRWIRLSALLMLAGASSIAQVSTTGGTYNPVNSFWWVFWLIYGIFAAIIGIAVLWHCAHGALGSHDGMAKVITVLVFGAIGFGVIFLLQSMVTGAFAPRGVGA